MSEVEQFISRLYRATKRIDIAQYRKWALDELQNLLRFDAAIWSTGHLSTRTFHTHTTLNLPSHFPDDLIKNIKINPITNQLFSHAGNAVDMRDVVSDEIFFNSDIYKKVFQPQSIERILSSIHIDSRSGIYTLLSIYRGNKEDVFTCEEKTRHQRALFHLIEAASHACMLSLVDSTDTQQHYYAICDRHGVYHEVEAEFLDIADIALQSNEKQIFPLKLPINENNEILNNFVFSSTQLGDLYRIKVRNTTILDALTERELEVVTGVTKGLSFKVIAKQLGLSPSTVSNHLYRIYQKLDINSRAELATIMGKQTSK